MYLKKIEIVGFKSFADPVTLLFDRKLTCVVGPNGSGKSNIADAIRWALGEQSNKLLRGKRADDVIFSGSSRRSRMGMAEVSIVLDNTNQSIFPAAEIAITRRIARDGESEYLLNQQPVRLQDITHLLAQLNIGQKSYAVIGQGMADSFIIASPRERVTLFQEATGIKAVQMKRDSAIQKLDKTKIEINRLDTVIAELVPRVKYLLQQREKLREHDMVKKEWEEYRDNYFYKAYGRILFEEQRCKTIVDTIKRKLHQTEEILKSAEEREKNIWDDDPARETSELRKRLKFAEDEKRDAEEKRFFLRQKYQESLLSEGRADLARAEAVRGELQMKIEKKLYIRNQFLHQLEILKKTFLDCQSEYVILKKKLSITDEADFRKKINEIDHLLVEGIKTKEWQFVEQGKNLLEEVSEALSKESVMQDFTDKETRMREVEKEKNYLEWEIHKLDDELKDLEKNKFISTDQSRDYKKNDLEVAEQNFTIALEKYNIAFLAVQEAEKKRAEWQSKYQQVHNEVISLREEISHILKDLSVNENEYARIMTLRDELLKNMARVYEPSHSIFSLLPPQHNFSDDEIAHAEEKLQNATRRLARIGDIDPSVEDECAREEHTLEIVTRDREDIVAGENKLRELITTYDREIEEKFNTGFKKINQSFSHFFSLLFEGGSASLRIENLQEDTGTLEKGIEIIAVPPGKRDQGIHALSGGEKALTSIALVSAIIEHNPAPFVVLDEMDAALDEANAQRFAKVIAELQNKSQIIAITHNRATMHYADILYGVSMNQEGVSQLFTVSLSDVIKK